MKEEVNENNWSKRKMSKVDKRIMFIQHCQKHPVDILRLGKATIAYGTTGLKARVSELAKNEWERQKKGIDKEFKKVKLLYDVKFSIIVCDFEADVKVLKKTLKSIENQTHDDWEVYVVDNGNISLELEEHLKHLKDNRIKRISVKEEKWITIEQVVNASTGDYLLFMNAGDELTIEALQEFGKKIIKTKADIIYGDMNKANHKGEFLCTSFKPDWSPDLFLAQMYMGSAIVIKTEQFKLAGGFRSEFHEACIYDLLLRISEYTDNIQHISEVLYTKRTMQSEIGVQKGEYEKKAVQEHLNRTLGENRAFVEDSKEGGAFDVRYNESMDRMVSIIIPTKDHVDDLGIALDSIYSKTVYNNYEIIILDNNSEKEETWTYFKYIQEKHSNIKVLPAGFEFNWSKLNNHGIRFAKGEVLVFLNNDVKVIEPTWLQRLAEHALRPNIGVVGGLLLYGDDSIQHAGVVLGMGGWADHLYKGEAPIPTDELFLSPLVTRNVMACTGACMAISRETIMEIGDFDERFIICGSDVEICIRAIEKGYKNIYVPQVKLYHFESKSRDSFIPSVDFELSDIMYSGYRKGGDPYYNKNLSVKSCKPLIEPNKKANTKLKTKPVSIGDIRELHFRKGEGIEYRLNLVLPALNQKYIFGGISTALSCFEAMRDELKCSTRIILIDVELDQKTKDKYAKKYDIVPADEESIAKHQIVSMVDRDNQNLVVTENDQFLFTSWWSAYIIQTEYRRWRENDKLRLKPFLYLVQDYEPGFYAWSPHYVLAEATYRFEYPQIAIFNSHELKEYIMKKGYKFKSVYCFEPILNSKLKEKVKLLDDTLYKRKQILVYGRPSVARNAFEIIVESLRKWAVIQSDVESWTILSAGEQHDPVDIGEGMYLESVGKLTLDEYAKILKESYAGISLMISPHPSYPPLEMAVFDVQVVTNSYGNKDMSYFSDNIVSVDNMSPVVIAEKLKKICEQYSTVVEHKEVNYDYVYKTNPFQFIKELKKEIEAVYEDK